MIWCALPEVSEIRDFVEAYRERYRRLRNQDLVRPETSDDWGEHDQLLFGELMTTRPFEGAWGLLKDRATLLSILQRVRHHRGKSASELSAYYY